MPEMVGKGRRTKCGAMVQMVKQLAAHLRGGCADEPLWET